MARQLVLQNLMKLAQGIGANPSKFMGTRTNISFLGKGPTKNPLFQGPLRGIESATEAQLGPRETIIEAVEDAMGFASANKLNSIQIRALELNLEGLNKIYNPPVLPMATVSQLPKRGSGITSMIDEMPLTRNAPLTAEELAKLRNVKPTRVPENLPPRSEMIDELGFQNPELYKGAQPGSTITKAIDESD